MQQAAYLDTLRLWVMDSSGGGGVAGVLTTGVGESTGLLGIDGSATGEGLTGACSSACGDAGGGSGAAATPMAWTAGSQSSPLTALMLSCVGKTRCWPRCMSTSKAGFERAVHYIVH